MKHTLKRFTSLLICSSILMSILGVIPIPGKSTTTAAAAATDNLINDYNFSFEDGADTNGIPLDWTPFNFSAANNDWFEVVDVSATDNETGTPTTAPDGTHILRFTNTGEAGKPIGLSSTKVPLNDIEYLWASVDMYSNSNTQLYIIFYDENGQERSELAWRPFVDSNSLNEWGKLTVEAPVPEGAVAAKLIIYKSTSSIYCGTSYFDRAVLFATDSIKEPPPIPPVPDEIQYNWIIAETEHPRVFFNYDELEAIMQFAFNPTETAMGYSGKETYDALIAQADAYLAETSFTYTWKNGVSLSFPVYPVLENMTIREEFNTPPAGYTDPHPYMTQVAIQLQIRMQALSLAYVLSGDVRYGERAVQYVTDMTDWEYWAGYHESVEQGSLIGQCTGSLVTAAATVYDMCYDLLTDDERAAIESSLINKALQPMYEKVADCMATGRDMDHVATTFHACAAILNADNMATLTPYLNRTMQYTNWMFDYYDLGHNEGYLYSDNGIEQLVDGLAVIERVTGIEGPFEHHFFTESLPAWIEGFVEPVYGTLPGYSDSHYSDYFTITLSTMARKGDNTAAYCLKLADGADQPFGTLIYTYAVDGAEKPADNYRNVTVDKMMGVAALRTGWGVLDKLMVMVSDDFGDNISNESNHAHYEANAIFMAMNGSWLIRDPGYGDINNQVAKSYFDTQYASNTIFVDNKAQSVKGAGEIFNVIGSSLYGHVMGSAPEAYGKIDGRLMINKFDRHTIMLNHDTAPYYVVIDDLAADSEYTFGWNMYHKDFNLSNAELDGNPLAADTVTSGNHLTYQQDGLVLHREFVGSALDFSVEYFTKDGQSFGPLIRANAEKSDEYQFMTVISVDTADSAYSTRVTETYNNETVLGALISYDTALSDIVLFNRGTGTMSGGSFSTDGQQATVMGLSNNNITEGFAVIQGTTAVYNGVTLMSANGLISIAVDYSAYQDANTTKVVTITTASETAREVNIWIGKDAPVAVTMDGVATSYTYNNGVLSLTVPAGEHEVLFVGTHICAYDREVESQNCLVTPATCTEGATYYLSCICGTHGEATFVSEAVNEHTYNSGVVTLQPTYSVEGVKTFTCQACGITYTSSIPTLTVPECTVWSEDFEDIATGAWTVGSNISTANGEWYDWQGNWEIADDAGNTVLKATSNNNQNIALSPLVSLDHIDMLYMEYEVKSDIYVLPIVRLYNEAGSQVGAQFTATTINTTNGEWKVAKLLCDTTGTQYANAKYARIFVYTSATNQTGTAYFDNLLVRGLQKTTDEVRYSFDNVKSHAELAAEGWSYANGTFNSNQHVPFKVIVDTERNDGVLAVDMTGITAVAGFYTPYMPITGGSEITVSADIKYSGTARVYLDWVYYTADMTYIRSCTSTEKISVSSGDGAWHHYSKTVTVPDDAAYITLLPYLPSGNTMIYFDNMGVCGSLYGHDFGAWEVISTPTCTQPGSQRKTCSVCGHTVNESIPAVGHTVTIISSTKPTCTTTGLTRGKTCTVCNGVVLTQKVIPATGHTYLGEITTPPTFYIEGVQTFTCIDCEVSYTEPVATLPLADYPTWSEGFENMTVGAFPSGDWTMKDMGTWYVAEGTVKEGSKALRLDASDAQDYIATPAISLEGLEWIYAQFDVNTNTSVKPFIRYYDANGAYVNQAQTAFKNSASEISNTNGSWKTVALADDLTAIRAAHPSVAYARIMIFAPGNSGSAYFDNMVLRGLRMVSDSNSLTFDEVSNGAEVALEGWSYADGTTASYQWAPLEIVIDEDTNSGVLKVDISKNTGIDIFFAPYIAVEGGSTINIASDIKFTGSARVIVDYYFYDAEFNRVGFAAADKKIITFNGDGTWHTYTVSGIAVPENAAYIALAPYPSNGNTVLYFDNMIVT